MSPTEEFSPETRARQAQHESGHAAAYLAQGLRFLRMTFNSEPLGLPRVEPLRGQRMLVGQSWLVACCGGIADQQRRGLRMRDSQIVKMFLGGGSDEFFELDDAETGEVVHRRVSRIPAISPGMDLHEISVALPRQFPDPAGECIRIWRGSELFAAECRPAIDALAVDFLARGELSYDEAARIASTAMTGKPTPIVPEWAWP